MSTTINILCVIDAESLAAAVHSGRIKPGKPSRPTPLGSFETSGVYVYMITESDCVINNQATPELTIRAQVGDSVRWTIANPDCEEYSCLLYNFKAPKGSNLLTAPVLVNLPIQLAENSTQDTETATFISTVESTWYSVVTAPGSVQYSWSFQVYDASQNLIGCFYWDPSIIISN